MHPDLASTQQKSPHAMKDTPSMTNDQQVIHNTDTLPGSVLATIWHAATSLDDCATRGPFDRHGAVVMINAYAASVHGFVSGILDCPRDEAPDRAFDALTDRWAGHVLDLASRWANGEPLAMDPFRAVALEVVPGLRKYIAAGESSRS